MRLDRNLCDAIFTKVDYDVVRRAPYRSIQNGKKDGVIWFLEYRMENRYKVMRRWDEGSLSSGDLLDYIQSLIPIVSNVVDLRDDKH